MDDDDKEVIFRALYAGPPTQREALRIAAALERIATALEGQNAAPAEPPKPARRNLDGTPRA